MATLLRTRSAGRVASWYPTCARFGIVGAIAAISLAGCGSFRESSGSQINQLGNKDFRCVDYDVTKIDAQLKDMPDGFINAASFRTGKVERVKNQLAGIPKPYLTWLYQVRTENGFRIGERPLGGSTAGVTVRRADNLVPASIDIAPNPSYIDLALQHEMGHALEARVRQKNPDFANALQNFFRQERGNPNLRSYARSSVTEYFAEAFANFYCSREAQNFFEVNLPQTYKLMKSSLEPASWDFLDLEEIAKDIWLQLAVDQDQPVVEIAAPLAVKKVGLCKGSKEECSKNPEMIVKFGDSPTKITNRSVFRSESGITIQKNMQLTVMLFDPQDKPFAARTVEFIAEDQGEVP